MSHLAFQLRFILTSTISLLFGLLLLWQHLNGGVESHHLLHNPDLPAVSNWWGLLIVPVLTWVSLWLVYRRIQHSSESEASRVEKQAILGFSGALIFGMVMSLFFVLGHENPMLWMMLGAIATSFFFPLFRPEMTLGFFLGMVVTFGAVIPLILATILCVIFLVAYFLIRGGILKIYGAYTTRNHLKRDAFSRKA